MLAPPAIERPRGVVQWQGPIPWPLRPPPALRGATRSRLPRKAPLVSTGTPPTRQARWLNAFGKRALWLLVPLLAAGALLLLRNAWYPAVAIYAVAVVCLALALHHLHRNALLLEEARAHTQAILDTAIDGV